MLRQCGNRACDEQCQDPTLRHRSVGAPQQREQPAGGISGILSEAEELTVRAFVGTRLLATYYPELQAPRKTMLSLDQVPKVV